MIATKTNKNARRSLQRRRGQGMTEYIIIVGLIAILMVGAVTAFKDSLDAAFNRGATKITEEVTNKMGGGNAPPAGAAAAD